MSEDVESEEQVRERMAQAAILIAVSAIQEVAAKSFMVGLDVNQVLSAVRNVISETEITNGGIEKWSHNRDLEVAFVNQKFSKPPENKDIH